MTNEDALLSWWTEWAKFRTAYEQFAKQHGLTHISLDILNTIYQNQENGCTQKLILDELSYPKQTINNTVTSFYRAGYITLEEDPEDRRSKRIILTSAGEKYAKSILPQLYDSLYATMDQFTEEEKTAFVGSIRKFANIFSQKIM